MIHFGFTFVVAGLGGHLQLLLCGELTLYLPVAFPESEDKCILPHLKWPLPLQIPIDLGHLIEIKATVSHLIVKCGTAYQYSAKAHWLHIFCIKCCLNLAPPSILKLLFSLPQDIYCTSYWFLNILIYKDCSRFPSFCSSLQPLLQQ